MSFVLCSDLRVYDLSVYVSPGNTTAGSTTGRITKKKFIVNAVCL